MAPSSDIFLSTRTFLVSGNTQKLSSTVKFYPFLFKIDIAVFLYYFTMSERGLRVYVNLLQKLDHVSKDHYT